MIDALIAGRLRGLPILRTTSKGAPFATFKLSAVDKNGDNLWVSCVTFSASAVEAVQRLEDGDSLAVAGELGLNQWTAQDGTPRHGLDLTAHQVMSPYHAGRKRLNPEPKAHADSEGA